MYCFAHSPMSKWLHVTSGRDVRWAREGSWRAWRVRPVLVSLLRSGGLRLLLWCVIVSQVPCGQSTTTTPLASEGFTAAENSTKRAAQARISRLLRSLSCFLTLAAILLKYLGGAKRVQAGMSLQRHHFDSHENAIGIIKRGTPAAMILCEEETGVLPPCPHTTNSLREQKMVAFPGHQCVPQDVRWICPKKM